MSNRDRLRDEYDANQEALGVTEERQDFFDDANAALGIGYSATMEAGRSKRILKAREEAEAAEIARRNSLREHDANIDRTVNKGAAEEYAALREMGFDHDTAMEMTANADYQTQDDHSSYEGYRDRKLGAPARVLMKAPDPYVHGHTPPPEGRPVRCRNKNCGYEFDSDLIACPECGREVKPLGLGLGNRKVVGRCTNCKEPIVTGIVVCQSCGTEYKAPRWSKDEELRSNMVSARITDSAKAAIDVDGTSYGDILNAIGHIMVKTGLPWEMIAAQLGILESHDEVA